MKSEDSSIVGSIAENSIKRGTFTQFLVIILSIAGILSFFSVGRLEDPEFTIKTALVMTTYPGASPTEVEKEISEPLEMAIQQMAEVDDIRSTNREGLSIIKVNMKEALPAKGMVQVWDVLRKKVSDHAPKLPIGAGVPNVVDDFGQVYGHLLALTADGYSYHDLEKTAKELKRKLSLVKDVSRVEIWGEQTEVIYVELNDARMRSLGITGETVYNTLSNQNTVSSAGSIKSGDSRLRVEVTGAFSSPEDIKDLIIRPSTNDSSKQNNKNGKDTQIRLGDIANITVGTAEPPTNIMRFNKTPAMGIAISAVPSSNIVNLGNRLKDEVKKIKEELPAGLNLEEIAWQADLIDQSINDFIINLIESLVIVTLILTLSMGWRMGVIIGGQLLLSILGTFIVMRLTGIDMQRVSLGAFIIAMGMIVDNAIVVSEGIFVRLQKGMDKLKAAKEAISSTAWPLLGATAVAVLAFYPIYGNDSNTGEFCASMFAVIAISLSISWVLAITVAPLHTVQMIASNESGQAPEESKGLKKFEKFLHWAIKNSKLFIFIMLSVLVLSCASFRFVKQMFFPNSTRPQLTIRYFGQEGTDIEKVSSELAKIEDVLANYENVDSYTAFIGQGGPRFYLPVESETQKQSYGEIIVNLKSSDVIQESYDFLNEYTKENIAGLVLVKKFSVGPGNTWSFELRIDGGVDADPEILKENAAKVLAILDKSPLAGEARTDWMEPVAKVKVDYDQKRGRISKVSREDVVNGIRKSFDGLSVGTYREGDTLFPIILRSEDKDRADLENLDGLQIYPSNSSNSVPLDEVVKNFKIEFEDPIIQRYNRHRMITVQTNPIDGVTFPSLQKSVIDEINKIDLPEGYSFYWDGEAESARKSGGALIPGIPPALLLMVLIVMALFNAYRPTIIIFMTIPFVVIGMVLGLLVFNAGFGFVALLGAMSLSGMMIKNGIVLLDEIETQKEQNPNKYEALITAVKSRLRPVLLAAGTTVLGCIPLLQDIFWESLAIVIMAGLLVGTIITMVFVPVMYSIFYGIKRKKATATK